MQKVAALRKLDAKERQLIFSRSNSSARLEKKYSKLLLAYYSHIAKCLQMFDREEKKNAVEQLIALDAKYECE